MKYILSFLLLIFFNKDVFSQYMEGYSTSSYAGINGINYNPASAVDSRTKLDINFFTASITIDNYYLGSNKNILNRFDSSLFEGAVRSKNGINKTIFLNADILGPSFLLTLSEKQSIGFFTQHRTLSNLTNVSAGFADLYFSNLEYPDFIGRGVNSYKMNFSTASWNEYGVFYGQEIFRQNHHWLSAGLKFKLTQGIHSAAIDFGALYTEINPDSTIAINGQNVNYFTSQNLSEGWKSNARKFNGIGFGFDLGFNYEWRKNPDSLDYKMNGKLNPAREMSKHKLRIGLTISDIGFVNYAAGSSGEVSAYSDDFNILNYNLRTLKGLEDAIDDNFTTSNAFSNFKMALPTSFSIQADYNIYKGFYVNTTYFHSIKRNKILSVNYNNRLTVTPRWDWRWMGAYVPYSFTATGNQHLGLNIMFGPFLIGTRDVRTFLWENENYFGNIHFGVKVTSLHFRPEDFDNDGVSNKQDICPEISGVWEFKGCPDLDGDSIPDAQDKCPNIKGLKEFRGCPDTDNDKVPDMMDKCPLVKGIKDLNGCPDTDGDGITDSKDKCPEAIGLIYFDGCPDADGDSVIDRLDACPELIGSPNNLGCPDSDGDGIYNYADSCIYVFGSYHNNGCPVKDDDGDNIINNLDKCPQLFGTILSNGCPLEDQDSDGVNNSIDKCPETPGDSLNAGCPIIEEEEKVIIDFAIKNLHFETGENVILEESFPSLDALAELLQNKKLWKLLLEGHTDNAGDSQENLILSKKRVEATKRYLVKKGVIENNLILKYFGETQPIADNSTNEGRRMNRRVVMNIIFN